MPPWNSLSAHWRARFGKRVQKIPLDTTSSVENAFTCPNRDGTLSRQGCTFCNAAGSGSGLGGRGMDLAAQWDFWRAHFKASSRTDLFLAYVQSYSNTYGPASRLKALLDSIRDFPEMAGLAIGTRPDCVDAEKVALLADMSGDEIWLELGVQTFDDATLQRINRGHDAAASERAIQLAARAGLKVCAHLMVGLPGEEDEQDGGGDGQAGRKGQIFLHSLHRLMELPVHGVKLHNVYVSPNTALAQAYARGEYRPLSREAYVNLAVEALKALATHRPDIIIHRVVADTVPDDLLAPDWVLDKHPTMLAIQRAMCEYHRESS